MTDISRTALFGKLNRTGYQAIEAATVFAKLRGNAHVELAHWLHQLLQPDDTDLRRILRHFGLDEARLAADVVAALDRLPRGATAIADFSPQVELIIERGFVYGHLLYGESSVRTGHLLLGALATRELRLALHATSAEFVRIGYDALSDAFHTIVAGSPEDRPAHTGAAATPGEASGAIAPAATRTGEALARYTVDLTEQARGADMDPIVGRDDEIRQLVDILMRRRQNNPLLTGEAGVGKTAVVEGFAQKIVAGDVPPPLRGVSLRTLDVGLLQAGASMKGEFEQRLRQVIEDVQASETPIILFIDEAHTLVGAGGAAGTGDAANLLKPALARGSLRTVAATTWAEYKKHIEKDPALTRRFQVVQVDEPDEARCVTMLRALAQTMEHHHRVLLLDEALEAAVRLSSRYIPARQLPDKAVSLLDTAAARVAIGQHAVPAPVDDTRKRVAALDTELAIIGRESAVGVDTAAREAHARDALAAEQARLEALEARWREEQALVEAIVAARHELRSADPVQHCDLATAAPLAAAADGESGADAPPPRARADLLAGLRDKLCALAELQGEQPLIAPSVDEQAVAAVVADWTGIPVGRMVTNELRAVLGLGATLGERVVGQQHALDAIAERILTSRANLDHPGKPVGVFLLAGPSGVGKTETALALAEALYGGEQNVITINMSEFQEAHTVSTLKGAPPGYVGYGEGGVLTEAVRRKPYSVVLLDEVEKAHPDVHEVFFQVFDKGHMEDGEGRAIDFRNTIILLTSNVGSEVIMRTHSQPGDAPSSEALAQALRERLLEVFPAALLGRMLTIPYRPLDDAMLGRIARLALERVGRRVTSHHESGFTFTDAVVDLIVSRCREAESGGRVIEAIINGTLLPAISRELLERMMDARPVSQIRVDVEDSRFHYTF